MILKSKKCENNPKRILHFSLNNNQDQKSTIKHAQDEGCKKGTIQHADTDRIEY